MGEQMAPLPAPQPEQNPAALPIPETQVQQGQLEGQGRLDAIAQTGHEAVTKAIEGAVTDVNAREATDRILANGEASKGVKDKAVKLVTHLAEHLADTATKAQERAIKNRTEADTRKQMLEKYAKRVAGATTEEARQQKLLEALSQEYGVDARVGDDVKVKTEVKRNVPTIKDKLVNWFNGLLFDTNTKMFEVNSRVAGACKTAAEMLNLAADTVKGNDKAAEAEATQHHENAVVENEQNRQQLEQQMNTMQAL